MTIKPTSTSILCAAVFVILEWMIISVRAFSLQPIGPRPIAFRGNAGYAEKKFEGVKLNAFQSRNIDGDEMDLSGKNDNTNNITPQYSRTQFLLDCRSYAASVLAASAALSALPQASNAKSYSENAKNLDRINSGDYSGGAVFDNNPSTDRGKKRRAMTGCKTPLSREEASNTILKRDKMLSEKECNQMVMDGETEFMLQALRNLDCPKCAYGIGTMD